MLLLPVFFTSCGDVWLLVHNRCDRALLKVLVNDYHCIWSSVMQELKNILGSRKKGAQEPHAAREPRNDYQGYTTTNLKGIFLERLPLTAGSSHCTCLLSFFFPALPHVTFRVLIQSCWSWVYLLLSESSVLMQDESRSMGDVAIDMDSQSNSLMLIDEQVDCHN